MVMARFGLVMVSSEMHTALTFRIYKNGTQQSVVLQKITKE